MTQPRLQIDDFTDDAKILGCEVRDIRTVAQVESSGGGFNPDDTPKTLFEGHVFYKLTGGKWATDYPTICYPVWTTKYYGKTWQEEAQRLEQAMTLDRSAALQSASWGLFQIMGSNYAACGFDTLQAFINAMYDSENAQLAAFTQLILHWKLDDELRNHDWSAFARAYNGSGQVPVYSAKLAAAYKSLG